MPVNNLIQLRKGSSSIWSSQNPVLSSGEPGYDLTNNVLKVGDGVTPWNNLSGISTNLDTSLAAGSGIIFSYADSTLTISTSGGGGGGGLNNVVEDITPQLGGNLDLNSYSINGTGNISISGNVIANTGAYNALTVNSISVSLSGHTHTASDITNFNEAVDDRVGSGLLVAGTGIGLNYNDTANTLTINVTNSPRLVTTVFNKTGSTIPKFRAVYINGGQGDQPTITLAANTGDATSAATYGVTSQAIDHMSTGEVVVFGALTGINTDQFNPSAPVGDVNGTILYLSASSGIITSTKPYAPNHIVTIGTIVRTHQNEGVVEVRIQNGFELEEIHDVSVTGVTNGQFLQYNSSNDLWIPSSSGNFSTLQVNGTAVPTGTGSSSYLTKWTSTNSLNNSIIYDNGTNIGIGTNSPSYKLDVVGTGNFSQNLLVNGTGVSLSGHTHTSSDITNFNSSVSGLLPTIANSGDNRVLTSTGSSVGINAESNLTFDGTLLTVTGSGTFASGLIINNQTASTIASFDANKNIVSLSTTTYPSFTELSYVKGVTSAIQTQIDGKSSTSHSHGNITSAGAIGSTANLPLITTTAGAITVGSFGSTASTFCEGNDSRLSDSRAPTGSAGGDLTGTYPNPTLTTTGVTGGTYRSVTVDTKGRITAGTNPTTIAGYGITDVGNGTLTLSVSGTGLSGSQTFTANQSGNATFTVTSNATSANTASTIVARDISGNFSAGTITATLSGTATQVSNTLTLNTSGTGLSGSTTFNGSGAATFTVTSNATSANTASTIVARDASGNFSAGTITATLSGNATTATTASNVNNGTLTLNVSGVGLSGSQTFTANQSAAATFTVTSNATSANTASTIVARDASGNFSAGTITATLSGNATTATTASNVNNGTLTLNVSGVGLSGSQTFTANQSAAATFTVTSNATSANTASTIVARDASGNFSAGTITATLSGNASTATSATTATGLNSSNYISRSGSSGNANTDFSNTPAGTVRHNGDDANLTNGPGNAWWFYDNYRHSNATNVWGTQIAWGWEDNANRLAQRNVTAGTWGAWVYYLNSGNYNSYAPSLTGGGASGTWGINITGNAATVTNGLTTTNYASNAPVSVRTLRAWGVYDGSATSANPGDGVNMGTMTRAGNGTYTCNFASLTLPNTNYGVLVSGQVGSMVTQTRNTTSVVIVSQNLNGVQTQAPYFTVAILDTP